MFYKSTRNSNLKVDSAQAISQGISEDGGLFVPESIPSLTLDEVKQISELSYSERARRDPGGMAHDARCAEPPVGTAITQDVSG